MASSTFFFKSVHLQVPVCSQCCELLGAEGPPAGPVTCLKMSPLQYKVLLYSLDGRLLSAYSAYEWSLGIKSVAWSPSSQFLAIGSYDGKVGSGAGHRPTPTAAGQRQPVSYLHVIVTVSAPGAPPKSRDLENDHRVWASCSH